MRELNQQRLELKVNYDEFYSVWMLGKMKKRKKIDNYELPTLRDLVKEGGPEVVKKLEKKFEGSRRVLTSVLKQLEKMEIRSKDEHYVT